FDWAPLASDVKPWAVLCSPLARLLKPSALAESPVAWALVPVALALAPEATAPGPVACAWAMDGASKVDPAAIATRHRGAIAERRCVFAGMMGRLLAGARVLMGLGHEPD